MSSKKTPPTFTETTAENILDKVLAAYLEGKRRERMLFILRKELKAFYDIEKRKREEKDREQHG